MDHWHFGRLERHMWKSVAGAMLQVWLHFASFSSGKRLDDSRSCASTCQNALTGLFRGCLNGPVWQPVVASLPVCHLLFMSPGSKSAHRVSLRVLWPFSGPLFLGIRAKQPASEHTSGALTIQCLHVGMHLIMYCTAPPADT